jgi:hypothetical protein
VDDEGGKERMTGDGYDRNVSYMHVKIAWWNPPKTVKKEGGEEKLKMVI